MLNKAHPTPIGRVLNTTCCRNIPIFVPRSIEIKNLFFCFLSIFFKKKLTLNPFRLIKKMKILKKKRLGVFEVYVIFLSCIYAGFIGYKSLLNVLFT